MTKKELREKVEFRVRYIHDDLKLDQNFLVYALSSYSDDNNDDRVVIYSENTYRAKKVIEKKSKRLRVSIQTDDGKCWFKINEVARNFKIYENWKNRMFVN